MPPDLITRSSPLQREIAERLSSFFVSASDGRSASLDAGAAAATTQGPHRERNEDRCAVVRFRFGSRRPDLRLGIICDGMGGMAKGGEAASLAIGSFIAAFAMVQPTFDLPDRLIDACKFANMAVFNVFGGEAGTTLTAIAFGINTRWAVHVGDSRLYGLDDDRQVDLLTQDDTVSGAVNAHLGQTDEDDMDNRLLQFIGIGEALTPHLTDVSRDRNHSLWLLTSDGAHSVGKKVLGGICEGSKSPLDLVRKLIFVSEAINTHDNATAICIKSGHIASSEDEHEGLTIQITAPDRNLDVWLPPSVVESGFKAQIEPSQPDAQEAPFDDPKHQLPRAAKARQPRLTRKKGGSRKKLRIVSGAELPLGVIFEVNSDDD
jgi:PPM family protein phosphatase